MDRAFIQMNNIVKVFPPSTVALDDVSVSINKGEIHAIIGENGAGKSTLMKALYALQRLNKGEIYINGVLKNFASPRSAVQNGIGMVHQELMLIPSYTILENIILGYEFKTKLGFVDYAASHEKVKEVAKQINFDVDLNEKIENLSVAVQQKVEIMKQLYRSAQTIIMDEPTAVLAPQEADELFKMFRKLKKDQGATILFISHKLDEILEVVDTITVMRQGKKIWTKPNVGLTKQDLASAMVGRKVIFAIDKPAQNKGKVILEVENLTAVNREIKDKILLDQVSFSISQGEIVGVAGVEGNGQYELVQTIMGLREVKSGKIILNGEDITNKSLSERRKQISYIPQDRKISGSSQLDSINDNAFMTHHYLNKKLSSSLGILNSKKISKFSQKIIENFRIAAKSNKTQIGDLSGGNQQKVIIGREFELNNPLIVLDQPVRGLDIGSIEYIQKRIIEQRSNGCAMLLVSADLDEIFALSDIIIVMYKGRIRAIKKPEETDKIEIGEYMLGVRAEEGIS